MWRGVVQAIRGRPTSWSYWSDLGWCYHAEGKQAAALKAFGRAEELLGYHAMDSREGGPIGSHETVQLRARVRIKTQVLETVHKDDPVRLDSANPQQKSEKEREHSHLDHVHSSMFDMVCPCLDFLHD